MSQFIFQDETFELDHQTDAIRELVQNLTVTETTISEKLKLLAIFNKAKIAYINDLKKELLTEKSGFDFLND